MVDALSMATLMRRRSRVGRGEGSGRLRRNGCDWMHGEAVRRQSSWRMVYGATARRGGLCGEWTVADARQSGVMVE